MLDPVVRPTNNPATTRIPLKICSCNPKISTKSRQKGLVNVGTVSLLWALSVRFPFFLSFSSLFSQVQLLWGPASCNSKAQTKISHTQRKNDNEEALLAFLLLFIYFFSFFQLKCFKSFNLLLLYPFPVLGFCCLANPTRQSPWKCHAKCVNLVIFS